MNPPKTPQKPAKFAPDARILVLVAVTFGARIDGGLYDYKVGPDQSLSAGDVVRVPLGARTLPGVVWGPGSGAVDAKKLKSVIERFQVAPMHRVMRDFIDWLAGYCLASPGSVLKMALNVPDALEPPKSERAWVLADEMPELKITPARKRVLEFMAGQAPAFSVDIAREAACSSSVITGLAKAGALEGVEVTHKPNWPAPDPDAPGPELSPAQTTAAKSLAARVGHGRSVTLLDGVPGSGKTEVYFEAVAEALRQGGQVLVLLPEIALSAQWLRRFEARFGSPPAVWHSDLGSAKRRETWRGVNDGSVRLVVGARSALFLPFHELSLIVIDEEHDPAFKQEEGVIYHARDMAVVRSHLGEIPIVLVSATPSLESATHAQSGKYHLEHLPERHAGATLPEVELVDMRAEKLPATRWLSDTLIAQLKAAFAAGEQAMLFLNRRGYAPLTLCRTCGHRLKCPHCSAWLVEHRQGARLQCHHCGFVAPKPDKCPECEDENSFAACGPGVERLAEEVSALFPDIRMALASSDTLAGPLKAQDLVNRIEAHDVDLIIGTQVVAKGYHFPLLTLVGVVDGDLGLAGGDLRAAERTYQLLYQVAGRAGREQKQGRVVVQTYMPDHPVMAAIQAGDRDAFVQAEMKARKAMSMPPFGRLVALIVSGPDAGGVDAAAMRLGRAAPHVEGVQVLGPAPAPLAMLRGKHRKRLLMKVRPNIAPQALLSDWLVRANIDESRKGRGVRITVDVDPQSFM